METKEKSSFFPRFVKPKEFVMSIIVGGMGATFCYLAITGDITPQDFKEVFIFALSSYLSVKAALSGPGNGK